MSMATVGFPVEAGCTALGRNGTIKISGIALYWHPGDRLLLCPITSRGHDGRCMIDIPASHLDQFLTAILALRAGTEPEKRPSPHQPGAGGKNP
jgi:hypothetical protein